MLPNKSLFPPFPTRPKISFYKIWPFFFGYCVQCKLSWQSFAILLFMDVLLPFWMWRWLPLTQYLYLVKFCAKDSGQCLFRGGQSRKKCGVGSQNFYHQIRWLPKIITEFGKRACTIFPISFVSKKDSPKWSRYLSPNLVIHKNHQQIWWKKLHFLNLFLFLKKITKMVTIFVTKIGEKNCTFLIYFHFLKKSPKWSL